MATIDKGTGAEVRDEIGDFVDEVLDLLSGARDSGKEDFSDLRARLQGRAQRLKDGALKGQAELRAAAESAASTADDYVHENPWQAIAAAGVVGLVLGMLLSRR
jgi:ElaB/YqjD/DUF883 family membrane-anchored ribosome-binding protein